MTKTILLTRPKQYNEQDAVFFQQLGYQCLQLPLITIQEKVLTKQQQQMIQQADWLLFTSQAAIKIMAPYIQKHSRIATVGRKTAQQLQQLGFKVDFISEVETKVSMMQAWLKLQPQGLVVYGKSQLADDYIAQQLKQHNLNFYEFIAYDNVMNKERQKELIHLLKANKVDTVYFASPSAWQRFYQVYQYVPISLNFIALGVTTQQCISKSGYTSQLKQDLAVSFL